jgi:ribosomal protein S18 acetylase RimI-like enzyme
VAITHRTADPTDFDWIREVVDSWWGRPVAGALPRLFLEHFSSSSLVAEEGRDPVGFLVGFHSPSLPSESYVHFVGVDPKWRRTSVGRDLYGAFFELARRAGRTRVKAVTSSVNLSSIDFHRTLGFEVSDPIENFNGQGSAFVMFSKAI